MLSAYYKLSPQLLGNLWVKDILKCYQLCNPKIWPLRIFKCHENHNLPIEAEHLSKIYLMSFRHIIIYFSEVSMVCSSAIYTMQT